MCNQTETYMYICIYVYMYTCICKSISISISNGFSTCIYTCAKYVIYMYTNIFVPQRLRRCVCVCVCVCVCICICINHNMCIHILKCTSPSSVQRRDLSLSALGQCCL